ncbi:daunorubicin/doxorubicin resistance ABC transporter ATP-binding protein DrrA [Alkalihalobacillus pseudalcaliphilus]|uniref:daunorubicin/doxorubicin resistance ABC transporter ATP-binding protein DrrA n=1 Tax=Alkalihalobacillus pseudalcaliphilus TaxID=79884 RepID=UPI00064E0AE6|nr:daunorubicin/doxorubicin resistance ABC transporter ATP-binding protein DrrA [Alkalihalobacillus pseudalcaliphilus]KMK77998.1 IclR family transcriptional regulator [Alkalihalobacillus pseudalcaliphilus]
MREMIISVQDVKKAYGKQQVLDGLSFEVKRGSIFALLGENGAGKTTMVRILSTLIHADSGKATIAGFDTRKDAFAVKQRISLTGQYAAVDELLTGEENLLMMGRLNHLDKKAVAKRTAELLTDFDLKEAAKRKVKTYSGGMRRRLDIAISLLASPEVIFLDEPTTGLDPRSRRTMWAIIKSLADQGVTIFLTTQYLEEADQLANKIAIIDQGKIVKEGTAEQLKSVIGEETVELTFKDLDSYLQAQGYLSGQSNHEERKISVPMSSPQQLRELLNRLYENGIEPDAVNIRKPTLDDVFMTMTNQPKKEMVANG